MESQVFYRGPSMLDGSPILGIVKFGSANKKTGNMSQTYIIPDVGEQPNQTLHDGRDASVCGDCPMRYDYDADGNHIPGTRKCYVVMFRGPNSMWKHHRSKPVISPDDFGAMVGASGAPLRLGAYGEPVAIPMEVWKPAIHATISNRTGFTGYTHQWKNFEFQQWKLYLMASIHDAGEVAEAESMDWRHFRSSTDGHIPGKEVRCPAPDKGVKCIDCQLCQGNNKHGSKSVYIDIHK